ncbi:MAG: site-specific integrase [Pseudomonadota bacterium]
MGLMEMHVSYRGLVEEKEKSGATRWRVRVEGNPRKRITLTVAPGHPKFSEHYLAARAGIKLERPDDVAPEEAHTRGSLGWLVSKYLTDYERRVGANLASAKTLKKKRNLLDRLTPHASKAAQIPEKHLQEMHDAMIETPSQAQAFIEAIRGMYAWAIKRGHIKRNTAIGIETVYVKGGGAKPWEVQDVRQFLKHHTMGTKPHTAMSLLLWTGCRVEDLTILGREYECVIDGIEALQWTPCKKGSSEVTIPFLAPLKAAVRAPTVQGATYVLGRGGKPYASGDSMSATFKKWCIEAGLPDLSAHGVRKALAELLAEMGCTTYEIMAILGHSESKTTEIYTRRIERWRLAVTAMEKADVSRAWF